MWSVKAGCFCDRHTAHGKDRLVQNLFKVFRLHQQMLLYCLVHGKVQYFLESRVWWRAKWAVVPLSRYRMCCAMWQRGGHGATVPQHYWDHPCLGASHLSGLTLLYCTVASWLPRELNTYWCMCVRENVPYLGLCLVGRHLKVALSPSNFFEGGSDGPIHHQAWSDQNSL